MGLKDKRNGLGKQPLPDWRSERAPSFAAPVDRHAQPQRSARRYHDVSRPVQSKQQQAQAQPTVAPIVGPPGAQPTVDTKPAAVSIQIQIPALNLVRWRRRWQATRAWLKRLYASLGGFIAAHRPQAATIAVTIGLLLGGLFVAHQLHRNHPDANGGLVGSTSGAGKAGSEKPPFAVVVPSTKPKLATVDGIHSVYDSKHNSFSYRDSLKSYSFVVSEQPIPPQFKDADQAVSSIASQLSSSVTSSQQMQTMFGTASVITNNKYSSQAIVCTVPVHDLVVFIQSSHIFTNSDWTDYINTLQ